VDLTDIAHSSHGSTNAQTGDIENPDALTELATGPKLNWVICGGESGQGARPMHPDWARSLRDQCAAAGTAFFFKQWGKFGPEERAAEWLTQPPEIETGCRITRWPTPENRTLEVMIPSNKKTTGALLDGREHKDFPNARL
jgi:hypothetical protein